MHTLIFCLSADPGPAREDFAMTNRQAAYVFILRGRRTLVNKRLSTTFPRLIPGLSPTFPRLIPYLSPIYPSKPPLWESSKISGMIRQWYLFGLSRAVNRYLQSSYTEEGDHAFSDHQK